MTDAAAASVLKGFITAARASARLTLAEPHGKAVLAAAGIDVPRGVFIATLDDIEEDCAASHFPLVAKGVSPQLIHKSDAGAVLLGNGGGTSVLAVDAFARAGIDIAPFSPDTVAHLHGMGSDAGAAYTNPVDLPQPALVAREGRNTEEILRAIFEREDPQAIVLHINLTVIMSLARGSDEPLANLLDAAVRVKDDYPGRAHFLLVLRSDGNLAFEEAKIRYRAQALAHGIPTYDEIPAAANAVAAIAHHERFLSR